MSRNDIPRPFNAYIRSRSSSVSCVYCAPIVPPILLSGGALRFRTQALPEYQNLAEISSMGRNIATVCEEVGLYLSDESTLKPTLQAHHIMVAAARQMAQGSRGIILDGKLVGSDQQVEMYTLQEVRERHYVLIPNSLPHGSEYYETAQAYVAKNSEFQLDQSKRVERRYGYPTTPETYDPEFFTDASLAVLLPDTATNRENYWVCAYPTGFILGPPSKAFLEDVPIGGNLHHERNHIERGGFDPYGYFLGENGHPVLDEALAIEIEWLLSREIVPGHLSHLELATGAQNVNNSMDSTNPFAVARQLNMRVVLPQNTHIHLGSTHPITSREKPRNMGGNLPLTTINQYLLTRASEELNIGTFDEMDGKVYKKDAFTSRTVFALWQLALRAEIEKNMREATDMKNFDQLCKGNVTPLWNAIQINKNPQFSYSDYCFRKYFRYDLHQTIAQTNRHLTLTELMDTFFSSIIARTMMGVHENSRSIPNSVLSTYARNECPVELKRQMELWGVHKLGMKRWEEQNERNRILLPVLSDTIFRRLMEEGNMRDSAELLWLRTGETFYENTIKKMTVQITPENMPFRYQEPAPI